MPTLSATSLDSPHPTDPAFAADVLDCLTEGVVLLRGQDVVYRNAAAMRLLADEGETLRAEAHLLGRRALHDPESTATGRVLAASGPRFVLRATRLRATRLRGDPREDAPLVVVTIERTSSTLPSPTVVMRQFNLTKREAGVALLVAQGHSNARVAGALGISESTARHYTESVFLKLGVRTRAAATAAVFGAERRRPGGARSGAPVRASA